MSQTMLGQLSDIDLRQLRVFRAVVESGGLSVAELELNIDRSTISRHIKDLEVRLGVTLCHRGRGGFSLTSEGERIYQSTLRLLAATAIFREEVSEVHQRLTGNIALAIFDKTVINPQCFIAEALQRFNQLASEVTLDVYVESLNDIERGIIDGRYQIGICPEHRPSPSIEYHYLFNENNCLYCGAGHPLFEQQQSLASVAEITNYKYAGLGYQSPNMERGQALGLTRHATAYNQEAVLGLLLSGDYIGFLPDYYAQSFVAEGRLKPLNIEGLNYNCDFFALNRHSPKPSRIAALFLDCLQRVHGGDVSGQ